MISDLARFQLIESAFHAALDRAEGAERDSFIEDTGRDDPTLALEIRQLLAAHAGIEAAAPSQPAPLPRFGAWQATRLLGRGGMGTVYLADRADGAFQMSAAVKVVPLALALPEIEDRFRKERQFLAMLDHPHIARLLDGGVATDGLPYLVMEFVAGQNIDVYCEEHHLDTRARVALIRQVLEALEYVHSRHVVHRDIKPSNIMVDSAGQPRLLDFGTARLTDPGSGDATTRLVAMTPHYASPEQARGETPTAASDIYSSGVLLYKLLTGRLPYRFIELSLAAVAATIEEGEPDPPGLDGPLNAILLKALRKNPADRYESAAAMAHDLECYLDGRPVSAKRSQLRTGRARILAAALAILVCAAIGWKILAPRLLAPNAAASIAVLPIVDQTADPANQYFSDGLTDEITDALARIKDLRVIARSSAFQFKGKTDDIREIGRRLGVAYLLEASVARTGDRLKIVAHLERVSDNSLQWSQTYDRQTSELSAVQAELVEAIARNLKTGTGRLQHVPNEEAHRLLMEGRYETQQASPESLTRAEDDYRRAIAIDPLYAAAYAGLGAAIHSEEIITGGAHRGDRTIAERYLRKALELDPRSPQARAVLAEFAMQYDWDWKRAEAELKQSLADGSSVTTEIWYASLLVFHGRFGEAEEHLRRAQDLDPYGTETIHEVARLINLEGRFAESRDLWRKVENMAPNMLAPKIMILLTEVEENKIDAVFADAAKLKERFPPAIFFDAMANARQGNRAEAIRLIQPFEAKYPNSNVPIQWLALVYAYLGDEANTVKWLERSADQRELQVMNIAVHPAYASMRNSPGFLALKKRMGLDR